jgi:hypothetical protein
MKTASTLLQLLTLAACLAANLQISGELHMPGMRRAIQTMTETGNQKTVGSIYTADAVDDL